MKKKHLVILCLAICPASMSLQAQSDLGVWTALKAEKSLRKKLSLEGEAEYRMKTQGGLTDRWSGSLGLTYKLTPYLKLGTSYTFLYQYKDEETTQKGNQIAPYHYVRHRAQVFLTGSYKINRFTVSLREGWQYTYRPEKTIPKYDTDDETWTTELKAGQATNVLRSRIQLAYNLSGIKLKPYVSYELYNQPELKKTRLTVGAEYKLNKNHEIALYYCHQNKADEDSEDKHVVGATYQIKF